MSNNNYTLSLNPNITTQTKKQEIQIENQELIAQSKPIQPQEAKAEEAQTQNLTQTNPQAITQQDLNTQDQATQKEAQPQTATPSTDLNPQQAAQENDLTQNAEYQDFIKQKLAQEQKVKEAYLNSKGLLKDKEKEDDGFSIHDLTGRNAFNSYTINRNKDKENKATIYDYLAKYGEHNAQTLGIEIDKDELKRARARLSIKHKNIKDLTEYERKVLAQNESLGSRIIDFFRDEKKVTQERKNKLTTNEIDANALIEIGKLHNITTSLLDFTKNKQEAKAQQTQFLKEASNIAKKYGYDTLAYDNKAKDYVLIKDGKKYYTDLEGFFNNFDKVLNNNYYDIVGTTALTLATGGTGLAGSLAVKGAQVGTTQAIKTAGSTLAKEAVKAGALSAALSPIDYIANSNDLNRDIDTNEMIRYSVGNALGATAGTLAIGGAIKGVSKSIDLAKSIKDLNINDLKNVKIKNILDNEEMAINRKLAKFDKSEIESNYKTFKNIQSDTVISKDIREQGILSNFIDKVNQYNPLEKFGSKKETQEKLLSSIFTNKELSKEFASKLSSEEAHIIQKAAERMGENFTRLSKEYEQEIIKEYVKSGKTHVDSVPALYKELLTEIDKEAKLNYARSIKGLNDALPNTDFKNPLLSGYKSITDDAIDKLGFENELTKTLIRETQKLESKTAINLSEAIEYRKDLNEIIRNYEKSSSDLKRYRAKDRLESLKANIDNAIKNELDSKVAKQELKHNIKTTKEANTKILNNEPSTQMQKEAQENIINNKQPSEQITKTQALEILENIKGEPLPTYLSKEEFLNGFNHIVNKENFIKHLEKAPDSTQRLKFLNLVEPTQKRADLELNTINQKGETTKEFIKVFENEDKQKYYILVTSADNENFLLTGIPTSKIREIKNRINKADIIEARDPGTLSSARSDSRINMPTPHTNNTTNTLTRQEADALFTQYLNANKTYANTKEALKDKFAKNMLKGMDKRTLDSQLTTEQWKKRVLDTDFGDSIKGLENTIFKNFNPRMQQNTQMLFIFRALDRNINALNDSTPINFTKILNDLEKLENLQLAPQVYPVLDLFKNYAKAYQFSQELARAKGIELMHGGGAMATTLSGRMQVFLTNRMFKKVFAHIPYLGDNNAILKSLSKAIKNLKYPSEITLETLKQLRENDLQRGFKPNAKNNNMLLKDITETMPKTDKELQSAIKGSNNRILSEQTENELESLATNPHLLELENLHKYETQTGERKDYYLNTIERTRGELANGDFVAKEEIKADKDLINLISSKLENASYTPDKVAMQISKEGKNYAYIQDKHGINYIYELKNEKRANPKSYDELMNQQRQESAELESYKAQVSELIEKRREGKEHNAQSHQTTIKDLPSQNLKETQKLESELKELDTQTALKELENIKGEPIPPNIDIETFLKNYKNIENKENFIKHLQSREDAESRLTYLNLVEPTLTKYDFVLDTINKKGEQTKEFIKVFNKDEKNKYYIAITPQDNTNFLLTGIYINREQKLINKMQKAISIKARNPKEVSPLQSPIANSNSKSLTLQQNDNIENPISKELLIKIADKQQELQKAQQKLELQTTQKGKNYFTKEAQRLETEIQNLEIQAGIRTQLNTKANRAKTQDLHDTEYTITTRDNQKLIFTENEMDNIKKALHIEYITEPKELSPNFKYSLDSKVFLDLPKYFKSVDSMKARQIKELENTLYNYDIALKDSNNNFYLFSKQGDRYFTLKGEKENGDYYIKGDKNLTHNEILDKIKSGNEVLHSTDETIKSNKQTLKPNEPIPYTKIRETSIQTEKMKEPVKADYVVIKKEHLKPNFTSENGLQYRNVKQQEVIKDIAENLKVEKLVNHEGNFQGLPLIQYDGQIISGNHRAEGLLNLNPTSRNNYEKAIKERFNIDLKPDELLLRRINDNVASDKILQLAKASNEGLENTLQEAVYTKLAKYEPYIKEIKELHADNLESLKLEINSRLKGGPTDIQETNLALLASQMKNTSEFIYALNSIQKKNDSEKIYNMLIDNAGSFYKINKAYNDLNISDLLQNSIQVLAHTKPNTRDTFKRIADDFDFYLKSSNREAIKEQRKLMGLNPDPLKDFKAEILGATLRRYITNNANPSEHLFNKIKTFKEYADETSGFDLFGNKQEINDSLFVTHLYADIADTRTDIGFLLKVSDTMQQLESKKIGLSDINDRNIRAYIEKLPKQVNDKIKEIDLNNAKIKDIRADFLERLKPLFNNEIENANGNKAYFNLRSLSKMMSDPAIQKSINNGFTREEHLNAVLQIEPLFKKSKLVKTEPHKSGENNTIINRFNAEYKNANALITSKESIDNDKNRIYSLELELIPRL